MLFDIHIVNLDYYHLQASNAVTAFRDTVKECIYSACSAFLNNAGFNIESSVTGECFWIRIIYKTDSHLTGSTLD